MPVTISEIDICNLALSHIGARAPIISFTEKSKEAEEMSRAYVPAVRSVLSAFDWNFARVPVALVQTDMDHPEWDYSYVVPSDCIRARYIARTPSEPWIKYEITAHPTNSGRILHTNKIDAVLVYTRYVESVIEYDPEFIVALSYYLAFITAMPITRSDKIRNDNYEFYRRMIGSAQASNANEGSSFIDSEAEWISARK